MRKIFLLSLVVAFVFTMVAPVQAAPYVEMDSPTVSSGSLTVIDFDKLPGTVTNASGLIMPAGFNNELQFYGKGAKVTTAGATICFSFQGARLGWKGKVYQWTGTKWKALTTTITIGIEDGPVTACAYGYSGTYALLSWYSGN